MNRELWIANWYNVFPSAGTFVHTLLFGFNVRVFLNVFEKIRPYFTHDICSHVVWVSDRSGHASTYGILLGIGFDIPLGKHSGIKALSGKEQSSLFFDVSYN